MKPAFLARGPFNVYSDYETDSYTALTEKSYEKISRKEDKKKKRMKSFAREKRKTERFS